jgi:hypothetical protein
MAVLSVLTIGVILEAEGLFVHFTHTLQIQAHGTRLPAAQAAEVAAANDAYLVIAMLIGAIVGMLTLGLTLGAHRIPAPASFAVLLAINTPGQTRGAGRPPPALPAGAAERGRPDDRRRARD